MCLILRPPFGHFELNERRSLLLLLLAMPSRDKRPCCRRCFGNLSKFEAFLIFSALLLLTLLLAVSVFWLVILEGYKLFLEGFPTWAEHKTLIPDGRLLEPPQLNNTVCTSRECTLIAGLFTQNLNENVDPCEDIFEFACGNYEIIHDLSIDKPMKHTIGDVTNRLRKQVKSVLEEPVNQEDTHWDGVTKKYFQNCLDEDTLQRTGVATLLGVLDSVGGWPVLYGNKWKEWTVPWEKQLADTIRQTGIGGVIIDISVMHDSLNSSINVVEIEQGKFGMHSRYYYLSENAKPMKENYTNLMITVAMALGANESVAREDMNAVVEFETALAASTVAEDMRRNPWRAYNPFQVRDLKGNFTQVDLPGFIRSVFQDATDITDSDRVIVAEVDYIKQIQNITAHTPKRVVANYVLWRMVLGFSMFLPEVHRKPFIQFQANVSGMPLFAAPPRWEDCVKLVTNILDMPVGAVYVKNFFKKELAMRKMDELALYLKEAFINGLSTLDWMDDQTKRLAIGKVNTIQYKTGFPPWIFNQTAMRINWGEDPVYAGEPLLATTIRLKLRRMTEELKQLKTPPDSSLWFQSPAQVDAYYAPSLNQMIFPAGIMQFPFLTAGVPNYVTFAMAGAVVGHEVSHAFDDQGGRYDHDGNLNDWWGDETAVRFRKKAQCFVEQYGNISVPGAGVNLNGGLSLGENIADNAGVKTAFQAYKLWQKKHPGGEPKLPGLKEFSAEKLFFMSYANNWCSQVRDEYYKQLVLSDYHSPPKYRALVPLSNVPQFAEAFNCPLGSPMNPVNKCIVW